MQTRPFDDQDPVRVQLARQVAHWSLAASELSDLSRFAPMAGWRSLERYLGTAIELALRGAVAGLMAEAKVLQAQLAAAEGTSQLDAVQTAVDGFRGRYLSVEAVQDFYGDAIASRADERQGAYLRACDALAARALTSTLGPLGRKAPLVLTYVDKGLGASVLKSGMRLWDGRTLSPAAAIKMARHNLYRPTSLLHEVGHEFAAQTGWTDELRGLLTKLLEHHGEALAELWSSWASEIAADAFAFAHTGYASVAALHDLLNHREWVLQHAPGDPHPVGYLRVLLGRTMCVRFFGASQELWDGLAKAWVRLHPLGNARGEMAELIPRSAELLPAIVESIFFAPLRAFGGKALADLVDPRRVSPTALATLRAEAGPSLFVSDYWLRRECLCLLALSGLDAASSGDVLGALEQQKRWMSKLGALVAAERV